MLRRIRWLNYSDAFIVGIVAIAVPVMMLDCGIDMTVIGLVFALVPLANLIIRLASAAAADRIGERLFYSLNAVSNLAQAACYSLSSTLGFALGKFFDGAGTSFIFAVNRTSVLSFEPHREHAGTVQLVSGRLMANALGSLAVFLLVPLGGYSALLLLIAALSLMMLLFSFGVKNTHSGRNTRMKLSDFLLLGRKRRFYDTTAALTVGGAFYTVMFYVAMPIFMRLSGMALGQIGLLYAAYFLLMGAMMRVLSRKISAGKAALSGTVIYAVALCGISFGGAQLLPYFFILMAFGDACLAVLWERTIYLEARRSKNISTDITLMQVPAGIAVFLVSGAFGFIIGAAGFAALFMLSLASFAAYAVLCTRLDRTEQKPAA